ncbi:hypothetical protein E3U43_007679 [Larimichthys crocea]|uniref:Uncharacterized protein n=1 Tax=Larimichthys crocea TaxID=215358 RepID=A0ACD3Q587_LARCR|nr:hypothetical protein E3U43_007679 [Larimichthys crocea]
MAAAAALSSSRGVAGVKGLFFIGTLMCLVCFVSSLVKQDQLEKLKEEIQKAQQKMDKLKATRASTSELMSKYMSFIDPLEAIMKETSSDFPPVEEFIGKPQGLHGENQDLCRCRE